MTSMNGQSDTHGTITGVDLSTGVAKIRDTLGKEHTVRADRRAKGSAPPAVGELWAIRKTGQIWALDARLGEPQPPVVTGSRAAADQVSLSLLAALVKLGLVIDETTT